MVPCEGLGPRSGLWLVGVGLLRTCLLLCQAVFHLTMLKRSFRAVLRADVYSVSNIVVYTSCTCHSQAYQYMQDLRSRLPTINLSYYINMRTIEAVHTAVGVPVRGAQGYDNGPANKVISNGQDDVVDDEVTEELYDDDNGNGFGFRWQVWFRLIRWNWSRGRSRRTDKN